MSKPKAFEYEAVLSTDVIIEQLEQIVAGLKEGKINLEKGVGGVALDVKPTAKLTISVKDTPKAKSLKLKIKWRDAFETDVDDTGDKPLPE